MASNNTDEAQLSKKHEEILGRRAVLLQQMEICYKQQKAKKEQRAAMCQAARERNAQILEDFQKVEECLQTQQFLHPNVLNLQTRYWMSVEQYLPEWEGYLLGKSQPPVREHGLHQEHQGTEQDLHDARAQRKGKSPRLEPKSDI